MVLKVVVFVKTMWFIIINLLNTIIICYLKIVKIEVVLLAKQTDNYCGVLNAD